ncbi:MAG TPA: type VI secretion system protein TssA [Thermoanaerobaculia bacterium]|nr:type VI secretion system protein TssA [Thermoanaerobaculia bacterium]
MSPEILSGVTAVGSRVLPLPADLDRLLAPISPERPAGEPLRYAGVYDYIQEARREDDATLPRGIWKSSLKRADWNGVMVAAMDALETRSKDLQLAVWLLEAWIHLHGVAGVVRGLELLRGLCELYWDDVHPLPEGGDLEYRLAPLYWMNEKLSLVVKQLPVTRPEGEGTPAYTLIDWENALRLENQQRAGGAAVQAPADAVTLPRLMASVAITGSAFYAAVLEDVRYALEQLREIEAVLDRRCGLASLTLHRFAGNLGAIEQIAARLLTERAERGEEVFPAAELPAGYDAHVGEGEAPIPLYAENPIRSRAEAYRRLSEAADYLLRTEPHSPAPYLVKRAVAWGGMSLAELLVELLAGNNDAKTIYNLLGIRDGQ